MREGGAARKRSWREDTAVSFAPRPGKPVCALLAGANMCRGEPAPRARRDEQRLSSVPMSQADVDPPPPPPADEVGTPPPPGSGATAPGSSAAPGPSSDLPAAPKPVAALIEEVLSGVPQTSDDLYKKVCVKAEAGAYAPPTLKMVQSTLTSRGEQFAIKRKVKNRTKWVRLPPGRKSIGSASKGLGSASKKIAKKKPLLSAKRKAELAKKEKAAANSRAASNRVDELLARPLSAFMLFGFSQRGVLKKQRTATSIKEAVKAIGERWLLLGEAERAKYEAMAQEDAKRAEAAASAREAAEAARLAAEEAAAAAEENGDEVDGDADVDPADADDASGGNDAMEADEGDGEDAGADDAMQGDPLL